MPATVATLNPNGGRPAVEIIIGNAQFASFDVSLFDATGLNPQKFGEGDNDDSIPDIFQIPGSPLTVLDQTTVLWRAVVSSFTGTAGETFSVTARVIQDGAVVASHNKTGLVTDIPPRGAFRLQMG